MDDRAATLDELWDELEAVTEQMLERTRAGTPGCELGDLVEQQRKLHGKILDLEAEIESDRAARRALGME